MAVRLRNPVKRAPVVPVVSLSGPIGLGGGQLRSDLSLAGVAPALQRAFRLRRAPAVALAVNSPGGAPAQADLIARRIRHLAERYDKPVYAFCEDVAASGGYWLACSADRIYALPGSVVGAIGVITAGFGFHRLIDRLDVDRRVYTAGESKAQLDPFRPEDPDDVARLRAVQDRVHAAFKAYVRARRPDLVEDVEPLFDGRIFDGERARELGLVDGLGEPRAVLEDAFGRSVRLRGFGGPVRGLRRLLGGRSPAGDLAALGSELEARALWARYGL